MLRLCTSSKHQEKTSRLSLSNRCITNELHNVKRQSTIIKNYCNNNNIVNNIKLLPKNQVECASLLKNDS